MALAAVAATLGPLAFAQGAMAYLLPNLRTYKPYDVRLSTESGRKLLRFANETPNKASGVLDVRPSPGNDCDGDGDPTNDRKAYQRLYIDADGDGVFRRSIDTQFRNHYAGCMVFHPEHNHWHFQNYAKYELKQEGTGQVVRSSKKVSFCMIDINRRYPGLAGSPSSPYYTECSPTAPMGISVGWSDVYGADLPGQYVDVTGVANGYYCLVSTVDPSGRLSETSDSDNKGWTRVLISGNSVTTGANCQNP